MPAHGMPTALPPQPCSATAERAVGREGLRAALGRPSQSVAKAFVRKNDCVRFRKRAQWFRQTNAVVFPRSHGSAFRRCRRSKRRVRPQRRRRGGRAPATPAVRCDWRQSQGSLRAGGLQQGRRAIRRAAGVEESGGKGPNIGKCKGNEGKIKKNGVLFCYEPQKCYLCSAKPRNPSGRRPAAEYSDGRLLKTTCMKSFYNTYYFFYFYFSTK
jgi:hypothetical protein